MYQLEVKRWLVFHKFPAADGWDITIDIDSMERGEKGQHPPDKKEIAAECVAQNTRRKNSCPPSLWTSRFSCSKGRSGNHCRRGRG